jgi:hypothetical protein
MQTVEIEKIKTLVQSSPILSSTERTEWLALLELMDDKQLGELEKILDGNKPISKTISSPLVEPGAGSSPSASARVERDGTSEIRGMGTPDNQSAIADKSDQSQMPKLSHIMNLPNIGNFGEATSARFEQSAVPAKVKPSIFGSKLKAIISEKDLPAGPIELDLPKGQEQDLVRKPVTENIIPQKKLEPSTKLAEPQSFFPVKDKQVAVESKMAAGAVKNTTPQLKSAPPILPKISPIPKSSNSGPEVNPKPQQSEAVSQNLGNIEINNLQDLALLNSGTLKTTPLEVLVKKIKALVGKYGYFEVVFNIEKSGVYKNYIDTGLKLLSEQSNFENLNSGSYLDKQGFEKFTDLLAKIQAS